MEELEVEGLQVPYKGLFCNRRQCDDNCHRECRHEACQGSVPQAIVAFLESDGLEDAIRNAVSTGGDSDTIAAIAGSVAEAFYGCQFDSIKCRKIVVLSAFSLRERI